MIRCVVLFSATDIGALARHIGARAHGNADNCFVQRGSIVDAIASAGPPRTETVDFWENKAK
jgi:hypothetical protein